MPRSRRRFKQSRNSENGCPTDTPARTVQGGVSNGVASRTDVSPGCHSQPVVRNLPACSVTSSTPAGGGSVGPVAESSATGGKGDQSQPVEPAEEENDTVHVLSNNEDSAKKALLEKQFPHTPRKSPCPPPPIKVADASWSENSSQATCVSALLSPGRVAEMKALFEGSPQQNATDGRAGPEIVSPPTSTPDVSPNAVTSEIGGIACTGQLAGVAFTSLRSIAAKDTDSTGHPPSGTATVSKGADSTIEPSPDPAPRPGPVPKDAASTSQPSASSAAISNDATSSTQGAAATAGPKSGTVPFFDAVEFGNRLDAWLEPLRLSCGPPALVAWYRAHGLNIQQLSGSVDAADASIAYVIYSIPGYMDLIAEHFARERPTGDAVRSATSEILGWLLSCLPPELEASVSVICDQPEDDKELTSSHVRVFAAVSGLDQWLDPKLHSDDGGPCPEDIRQQVSDGVSIHPVWGGWYAYRALLFFRGPATGRVATSLERPGLSDFLQSEDARRHVREHRLDAGGTAWRDFRGHDEHHRFSPDEYLFYACTTCERQRCFLEMFSRRFQVVPPPRVVVEAQVAPANADDSCSKRGAGTEEDDFVSARSDVTNATGMADVEELHKYAITLGLDPGKDADLMWIAEEGISAPLLPGWIEYVDAHGRVFYHNVCSLESSWTHPLDQVFAEIVSVVKGLWANAATNETREAVIREHVSHVHQAAQDSLQGWTGPWTCEQGQYYYNKALDQSSWDDPATAWHMELETRIDVLQRALFPLARTPRFDAEEPAAQEATRRKPSFFRSPSPVSPSASFPRRRPPSYRSLSPASPNAPPNPSEFSSQSPISTPSSGASPSSASPFTPSWASHVASPASHMVARYGARGASPHRLTARTLSLCPPASNEPVAAAAVTSSANGILPLPFINRNQAHPEGTALVVQAIDAFVRDSEQQSLELPSGLTASQRQEARNAVSAHAELVCESFGFGEERRLHIFRENANVKRKSATADDMLEFTFGPADALPIPRSSD